MFKPQSILEYFIRNNINHNTVNDHKNDILGFSPLKNTGKNTVTWIKGEAIISSLASSVLIVNKDFQQSFLSQDNNDKMLIFVENPRLVFALLMREFHKKTFSPMIMPSANVSKSAILDKEVYIGENVVIGENVEIKKGTYIHPNVVVHDNVKIGESCEIHVGAVIGSEGFGYEQDFKGDYFNIPHIGGVILEDNVSIGSNTCIDRGVLDDTVIGENTKIDNLCHVAHNCLIGKNNMITASTMIAGSVVSGDNVWFAPSSVIKNGLHIGENSLVGLGAVATKNVEKDDVVAGVPAKSLKKR